MKKLIALAVGAVALAAVAAGCGSSNSSSTSSAGGSNGTPTVSIMVGGLDKQIYLPFTLAEKLGYYKQAGVNVKLSDEPAGVEAADQLVAGKVDGVGGFYDHTVDLQGSGKMTESVVQLLRLPGETELCRNDELGQITSPADWSGKRLGVTGLGSSTYFLTEYLAQHNGVPTNKITPVPVEAGPTFLAAMQHKSIDCGITSEPTASAVQQKGLGKPIVDLRKLASTQQALGGVYPATALYMRNDWVQSHQAEVQKVVNALVKTMKWINTHSAAQITAMVPSAYYQGVGKAQYIAALQNEKEIYNPTGIMPQGGPETILKVLSSFDPNVKGKQIDLSKTYTTTFAQKAQSA